MGRDAVVLACHSIGHHSIRLVLEMGMEDQRYRLIRIIEKNMCHVGMIDVGGAVICTALTMAAVEDRIWIARAVLQDPKVLLSLASGRQGNSAVLLVLQTLKGQELEAARAVLFAQVDKLRSTRHGQTVVEYVLS